MKKIKFLFFTLLFCFSVPVKADTAFENDDTVLCSFLKENVPENASPIESSLENEYRKTSSKPIDFYFFKRSEKTKSFQDLYAANVLTYQEKSDRSLLYQTVFDFQNITQVRTAKEDFIRLETDPLMYLFELEKAELWTRNSTEEPWTLERKITTPGNPDFYLPYSQFSSDKKYFRILASFSWSPSPAEESEVSSPEYHCIYTSVYPVYQIPVKVLVLICGGAAFFFLYRRHKKIISPKKMFRKLRLFNMFSSLFRANFQNATHLIGVALSAFHCIPNPLQCLGQGCARAGDVDPLEAATAVSEDLAAVEPQLRLVDHQVFQFING